MKVVINGNPEELSGTITVQELLAIKNVEMPEMVSVELNGAILRRGGYGAVMVKEDDVVEFLYFMGGGAAS